MKIELAKLHIAYKDDKGQSCYKVLEVYNENESVFCLSDDACYLKAKLNGIPTFTLIARDPTAGLAIECWFDNNPQLSPERKAHMINVLRQFFNWEPKRMAD